MKSLNSIVLGFIGGIICIVLWELANGLFLNKESKVELLDESYLEEQLPTEEEEQTYKQWFELPTKDGEISMYVNMPKDSVKLVMGKPNSVDVMSFGQSVRETWEYRRSNRFSSDITITFLNGELINVSQY